MENLHVTHDQTGFLDKLFNNLIRNNFSPSDERLEIYNFVTSELYKNKMFDYLSELKYRITDGENPNKVMLEIATRDDITQTIFWPISRRLQDYWDEDLYSEFYF